MSTESITNKKYEKFVVRLEGDKGMDIDSLLAELEYIKTTINIASRKINNVKNYDIRVSPFKEGSFEIQFDIISVLYDFIPVAITLGKVLVESVKIWKASRGKPPTNIVHNETNNTYIINGNNNLITTVSQEAYSTVSESKAIAEKFSDVSRKLENSKTNRGDVSYSLMENNQSIDEVKISKDDIKETKNPVYYCDIDVETKMTKNEVVLKVSRIDFEKENDWRFISSFSDKPFKAQIEDKDFLKLVKSGEETFGAETRIKAVLLAKETITKEALGRKNVEYTILKVLEIIKEPEQINLDL